MSNKLLIDLQPAIDERWFEQLIKTAKYTPEIYAWLGPTAKELQEQYSNLVTLNFTARPNLRPRDTMCAKIISEKQNLTKLQSDVMRYEQNDIVRNAYRLRLEELIDNAAMYEAALLGDDLEFTRLNHKIYGQPQKDIFVATCEWFRSYATAVAKDDRQYIGPVQAVLDVIPQSELSDTYPQISKLKPSKEVFASQHRRHMQAEGFYEQLFHGLKLPEGPVDEQSGDRLIQRLLKNLQAEDYTIHNSSDGSWGLRFSSKSVVRPSNYVLPADEFVAVAGHEVGSHLLERLNGLRSPLRLLSFGLQGYEKGNEGRALLREQVVYKTWSEFEQTLRWQEVLLRHFVLSLAVGLDGSKRTFTEIFNTIEPIYALWHIRAGAKPEAARRMAQQRSWLLITRALKGTDTTGVAYHKDLVYLEGNIACWRKATEDPMSIRNGDRGKIDIANSAHIALV